MLHIGDVLLGKRYWVTQVPVSPCVTGGVFDGGVADWSLAAMLRLAFLLTQLESLLLLVLAPYAGVGFLPPG